MSKVRVLLNDIKRHPETWRVDKFWAKHESGTCIWMGNGFLQCRMEKPEYAEFGLSDRFKLYRALRELEKIQTLT